MNYYYAHLIVLFNAFIFWGGFLVTVIGKYYYEAYDHYLSVQNLRIILITGSIVQGVYLICFLIFYVNKKGF